MRAYAERLGGRLIVEPTGPVGGASATGAAVYLQKVAGMDQVLGMMKSAAAGEGRLPTEVVRRVFDRLRRGARAKDVNLTQREREILVSFCRGMSYVAIAAARGVKVVTVRPSNPTPGADVATTLPVTTDCGDQGAVCTSDGRMLSKEVKLTVTGPDASSSRASTASATVSR